MTNTTHKRVKFLLLALVFWANTASAQQLALPSGSNSTASETADPDSYALPVGPWAEGYIPTKQIEGRITKQAWRIESTGLTTLQILAPLRDQLTDAGYEILYECTDRICGGFDFRFGMDVLRAPDMYVDLTDYRYLAAANADATRHVSLLASRSAGASFVQIVRTGPSGSSAGKATTSAPRLLSGDTRDLAVELEQAGHVVLSDLQFETGSSSLGAGPFDSLQTLADYLKSNPTRRIALVGHTDSVGSLDGNIALSRRRAASVVDRLNKTYGVPRNQLDAQGMGYLAPITTNLTPEGREANRRVEAILTSTE